MKYLVLLSLLTLTGCGITTTGDGIFNGRVVDVHWGGLFFKSCEVDFQLGQQSSSKSTGSTRDKALCDKMIAKVGEVISIKYKTWIGPCCMTMDSNYEIFE